MRLRWNTVVRAVRMVAVRALHRQEVCFKWSLHRPSHQAQRRHTQLFTVRVLAVLSYDGACQDPAHHKESPLTDIPIDGSSICRILTPSRRVGETAGLQDSGQGWLNAPDRTDKCTANSHPTPADVISQDMASLKSTETRQASQCRTRYLLDVTQLKDFRARRAPPSTW